MSKVLVLYKSGERIEIECSSFTVSKRASQLTEIEWSNDAKPRPLFMGIDDIAAVFEVKS